MNELPEKNLEIYKQQMTFYGIELQLQKVTGQALRKAIFTDTEYTFAL